MTTTLFIDGMRSVHCVRAVFTALAAVPGLSRADVSLGRVVVEHDGSASEEALSAAIEALGYVVRDVIEERRRLVVRDPSGDATNDHDDER